MSDKSLDIGRGLASADPRGHVNVENAKNQRLKKALVFILSPTLENQFSRC